MDDNIELHFVLKFPSHHLHSAPLLQSQGHTLGSLIAFSFFISAPSPFGNIWSCHRDGPFI